MSERMTMVPSILLIEDDPDSLDLMSFVLRAFGHLPLLATNGAEGLEIASRQRLDLIVCDIQMPVMDGFQLARQLKRAGPLSRIPLIAVTSLAMVGDRGKVLAAGFDGYIEKPLDPETFVQQLESFLPPGLRVAAQKSQARTSLPDDRGGCEEVVTAAGTNGNGRIAVEPSCLVCDVAPHPTAGASILIVDNSAANLELLVTMLQPFRYLLQTANSVGDAIRMALRQPPDLIMSDVHMPGEDGFDLLRQVKSDAQLRDIPFVVVSSSAFHNNDRARAIAMGARKFLDRPLDAVTLVREIEECLLEGRE